MILLLTGLDQADSRLLRADVAGTPLVETLAAALSHLGSPARVVLAPDASGEALDGTTDVLIADADVWYSVDAVRVLLERIGAATGAIRVTAPRGAGSAKPVADTLAVWLPGAAVAAALGRGTAGPMPRAAGAITPPAGTQDVDAAALDADHHPRRVRTMLDLAACEKAQLVARAAALALAGVRVRDPERVAIRGELRCGTGVEIDVNVIIEGTVVLGNDVTIGANCILIESTIGDGTVVRPNSIIDHAVVGARGFIGPYGRLRPGAVVGDAVQIGNFVEIKNSAIGAGSRINHLAFVGDATLGVDVTMGAATVTCNHDRIGVARTVIGDGAYVGSGSMLVAPLVIGEHATIGAGSTVTADAPAGQLTLGRARQVTVPDWRPPRSGDDAK